MTGNHDNKDKAEINPITGITRLTRNQLEILKSHWIITIDEFVAVLATEQGRISISRALDLGQEEIELILNDARDIVGEDRYEELMDARPGGPTGALINDDKSKPGFPEAEDQTE